MRLMTIYSYSSPPSPLVFVLGDTALLLLAPPPPPPPILLSEKKISSCKELCKLYSDVPMREKKEQEKKKENKTKQKLKIWGLTRDKIGPSPKGLILKFQTALFVFSDTCLKYQPRQCEKVVVS